MPSNIENSLLQPAKFRLDGGAMYGIIPKPLWNKVSPADDLNRIDLALRLWLIKTKSKIILIDTGIGDYHGEKFDNRFDVRGQKSPLEEALKSIGLAPEDITDLIVSHLHFDHVGGLSKKEGDKLVPVLPHCKIHIHQSHYEYAQHPTKRDGGSFHNEDFEPVLKWYQEKGQLVFHQGQEGELLDLGEGQVLKFKCSHGHTPHLMHPYSNQYIYMADLIPTSNHISIPWVMGYDISPGITTEDKESFLNFILDKNLTMIFEHDPLYWGATLKVDDRGNFKADEKYENKEALGHEIP